MATLQSPDIGIARSVGYWTTTALIALAFLSGGAAYLFRVEETLQGMAELGPSCWGSGYEEKTVKAL